MARLARLYRYGAVAGGLALLALSTGAGQPQANPDYGFVLSDMSLLFYLGDDKLDCPNGRSPSTREAFLESQTPVERARLQKPENAEELEHKYKTDYVFGPGGKDICSNPEAFDTPERILQKPTQSKIAPGMDLDGAASADQPAPGTCGHDSFVGTSGAQGVDNQYYRAIACNTLWRGVNGSPGDFRGELHWHDQNAVAVVVRSVDSWDNDPQVEVVIAASADRPPVDATQKIVDGGSVGITPGDKYRTVTRGRIENGVLITEPANVTLPMNWVGASGGEFMLRHARIRAKLTPEGGLKGEAGGYRPIDNAMGTKRVGGPGVASTAGLECASVRKTLRLLADGDRDPKTGQCASVSTALSFAALPAFVFDQGALVGAPGGKALRQAQR
ncbi:hypothetical protein LJR219_004456 [Phenylobacterium sp. LjRoot219]|uniref:hypothetical protein n=1 Tax=Phenylobacterium sp. LjRoot219 TaxID=3342283 RepID=UPI003ED094EC